MLNTFNIFILLSIFNATSISFHICLKNNDYNTDDYH